jgi:hypothetical protein
MRAIVPLNVNPNMVTARKLKGASHEIGRPGLGGQGALSLAARLPTRNSSVSSRSFLITSAGGASLASSVTVLSALWACILG